MLLFRFSLIAFTAFVFAAFPVSIGAGELRQAFQTATGRSSLLTHYEPSEQESTISTKTIREASQAVVLITAYEELPVYAVSYERIDSIVETRREQIGAVQHLISSGSAFFATSDGYLITNKHVVANTDATYYVSTGEAEYDAHVVYRDPEHDIAVLKVHGKNFSTLPFGNTSELEPGEAVAAIGNALGTYVDSTSVGKVLSLSESIIASDRSGSQTERLTGVIETSAKLYPGDSGGPLLNVEGEVVGVSVATTVGERIGYAVPVSIAQEALQAARATNTTSAE